MKKDNEKETLTLNGHFPDLSEWTFRKVKEADFVQ